MKIVKLTVPLLIILIFSGFVWGVLFKDGSPAGYTGSPFDQKNCTFCHAHVGQAVEKMNFISTNIPVCGFIPDDTYTITVTVSSPGTNTFGFICSAHNESGTTLGTHIITDSGSTKIIGSSTKYVTHRSQSTQGTNNTLSWSFNWKAPQNTDEVTFYAACTAGPASADSTFVTSLTVYSAFTSVESYKNTEFSVFPNPAKDLIYVRLPHKPEKECFYSIFSIHGKLIEHSLMNNNTIDVQNLKQGNYVLCIEHSHFRKCFRIYKF